MGKKKKLVAGTIIGICVVALIAAIVVGSPKGNPKEKKTAGNGIGVIRIEGTITGGAGGGTMLGGVTAGADRISAFLEEAREDRNIKAVLLRINSPGGSAAASQEISEEVDKLRAAGKPVVVSMGDAAASGGYWIAVHGDTIMANPATTTGSIGVIMQTQNLEGLYEKLGIKQGAIKSAEHKDMGAPYRPMTEEERSILQGMVDDIFDQFVEVVAKGRNMPLEKVRELADGRVFTGRQALELGLVDRLGNYNDAVALTAELAELGDNYYLQEYGKVSPWQMLFGAAVGGRIAEGAASLEELSLYRELFKELFSGQYFKIR